jgi:hypothetical protein
VTNGSKESQHSLGPFPGAAQPYSHCCCLPLGSRPGLCRSLCAHACVLGEYVSPRVDLWVKLCTFVWFRCSCSAARRPSLFCGVPDRWKTFLYFMGQHMFASLLLSLSHSLSVRGCLLSPCGSPSLFSSVSASGVRLVLRRVCRTLYCLPYILPGASPRALPAGGSYSSGLVTCRCLAPARHVG